MQHRTRIRLASQMSQITLIKPRDSRVAARLSHLNFYYFIFIMNLIILGFLCLRRIVLSTSCRNMSVDCGADMSNLTCNPLTANAVTSDAVPSSFLVTITSPICCVNTRIFLSLSPLTLAKYKLLQENILVFYPYIYPRQNI